jgi:hypothetical protein
MVLKDQDSTASSTSTITSPPSRGITSRLPFFFKSGGDQQSGHSKKDSFSPKKDIGFDGTPDVINFNVDVGDTGSISSRGTSSTIGYRYKWLDVLLIHPLNWF